MEFGGVKGYPEPFPLIHSVSLINTVLCIEKSEEGQSDITDLVISQKPSINLNQNQQYSVFCPFAMIYKTTLSVILFSL